MRKKLIVATTAGALTLTGLALAVPALPGPTGTADGSSSAVERITDALSGLVTDGRSPRSRPTRWPARWRRPASRSGSPSG